MVQKRQERVRVRAEEIDSRLEQINKTLEEIIIAREILQSLRDAGNLESEIARLEREHAELEVQRRKAENNLKGLGLLSFGRRRSLDQEIISLDDRLGRVLVELQRKQDQRARMAEAQGVINANNQLDLENERRKLQHGRESLRIS